MNENTKKLAPEGKLETPAMIEIPHTMKLERPFTFGDEEVNEVVIVKELDAGDLADVMNEKRTGDQMIRMVSAVTEWPDPKVKKMKARDLMAVVEVVQDFLPDGLVIGN